MSVQPAVGTIPTAGQGIQTALRASAALAAAGATASTSIVSVEGARKITLFIKYTGGAAGGYPHILPLVSGALTSPATTDDSWYALGVSDGAVTADVDLAALPTNVDISPQNFGEVKVQQMLMRLAATNSTDAQRIAITLDVTPYRWLFLVVAEKGVTGTPGTLAIDYVLSV